MNMRSLLCTLILVTPSCGKDERDPISDESPQDKIIPVQPEFPKEIRTNKKIDGYSFYYLAKDNEDERYSLFLKRKADFEYQNMQLNGEGYPLDKEFFPVRPFEFEYVEPILNAPKDKDSKPVPSNLELKKHVDHVLGIMKENCPAFFGNEQWPKLTVRWGQEVERNVIGTVSPLFRWAYIDPEPDFFYSDSIPLTMFAWNRLERSQVIESTRLTHRQRYGYEFSERTLKLTDSSFEFWHIDGPFFDDKLAHEIAHSIHFGWWYANSKRMDMSARFAESTAEWIKGLCYNNDINKEKVNDWYSSNSETYAITDSVRLAQTWPFSSGLLRYAEHLGQYNSVLPLGTLLGVLHMTDDPRASSQYLSEMTVKAWRNMKASPLKCYSEKYCAGYFMPFDHPRKPHIFKLSNFLRTFNDVIGGVPEDYRLTYLTLADIIEKSEK